MNFSRDMGIPNNIILEGDVLKIIHALPPNEGQSWSLLGVNSFIINEMKSLF